jgi:hypothetical protein
MILKLLSGNRFFTAAHAGTNHTPSYPTVG